MPLVRCIVKSNESPFSTHAYFPLRAIVKLEGNKKPDTLDVSFPTSNNIKENFEITYIQDIIDTTYLRAIYPMHLSCLDESGFDQDPIDPPTSRFVKVTSGRYRGHYALDFTADAQGVEVPNARVEDGGKIDLSKQFDIHIKFTPNTTQLQDGTKEPILWSLKDGNKGLDIGFQGTNGDDPSWKVHILYHTTGGIFSAQGTTNGLIMHTDGSPVHIRVKRGQDGKIKAYVDGIEEISVNESRTMQPTTTVPMVFGDTETSTNDEYIGQIHEIRVYCGTDLDDEEAERIRWSKPIPQVMKFAGRVVKLTSNQVSNKLMCQSNSFKFTKGKLGGDAIESGDPPVERNFRETTIDFDNGSGNLQIGNFITGSSSGARGRVIEYISGSLGDATATIRIQDRESFTSSFKLYTNGEACTESGVSSDWTGNFVADSEVITYPSFTPLLQEVVDVIDSSFTVRNVDLFEETTKIVFDIRSNILEIGAFFQFLSVLLLYSDTTMYMTPRKNIIIEQNIGQATDYVFDQNGIESSDTAIAYHIKDSETNDVKLVNDVTLTGRANVDVMDLTTPTPTQRKSFTPSSGIIRALRRNVQQIDNEFDLLELTNRTALDLQGDISLDVSPTKYLIQSSSPIHHVRYNHTVQVKRNNGYNDSITFDPTRGTDDLDEIMIVRQLEYHYPSGKTMIKVGENDIDYYDDVVNTSRMSDGLLDTTLDETTI